MSQFPIVDSLCKHDFFLLFFYCLVLRVRKKSAEIVHKRSVLPKCNLNLKKTNAVPHREYTTRIPKLLQNSQQNEEKINKNKDRNSAEKARNKRERRKMKQSVNSNWIFIQTATFCRIRSFSVHLLLDDVS